MQICRTISDSQRLRDALSGTVALVPTMGNLHQGHLELVRQAKQQADHVLVSIFVNPMQFGANEDLDKYPRTLQQDIDKLSDYEIDLLFTPDESTIYPEGVANHTVIDVPNVSSHYCGANRPGHFSGVATIVLKLFTMLLPDVALFGKKDFQQLAVINKLARDMTLRTRIIGIDTQREESGLALSSRNQYLSQQQRSIACELYRTLVWAKTEVMSHNRDYDLISQTATRQLNQAGFQMEYFAIADQFTLNSATSETRDFVILAAGRLGTTRLIDNIDFIVN